MIIPATTFTILFRLDIPVRQNRIVDNLGFLNSEIVDTSSFRPHRSLKTQQKLLTRNNLSKTAVLIANFHDLCRHDLSDKIDSMD